MKTILPLEAHFHPLMVVDTFPLIDEVMNNRSHFGDLTFRQDHPLSSHKNTQTIYLRSCPGKDYDAITNSLEVEEYPAWELMPNTAKAAQAIADAVEGRLARVLVIALAPDGVIKPHVDDGTYAHRTERFHLPILTNPGAFLEAAGDIKHLPAGVVWWFDKHVMHSGANFGTTTRVHLVVDVFHD